MNTALLDLIFWIVIFAALFLGIRWLQKRNRDKD